MSAPLHVVNAGDEPVIVAGVSGSVSVRDVVAWALEHRPDIIADATLQSFPEGCPEGFDLARCDSCGGRGIVPARAAE